MRAGRVRGVRLVGEVRVGSASKDRGERVFVKETVFG